MNKDTLVAAAIRAFWAFVFPMLGALVLYLTVPANVESVGVTNVIAASLISGLAYGAKKLFFPDTKL